MTAALHFGFAFNKVASRRAVTAQRMGTARKTSPDAHPPSVSTSSSRFSRWALKPSFGEINITLDSAQGLVVDRFFVAQFDYGVAFCL